MVLKVMPLPMGFKRRCHSAHGKTKSASEAQFAIYQPVLSADEYLCTKIALKPDHDE